MSSRGPPAGFVTFLFTDVESSTKLFRELGSGYPAILEEHHQLLRRAIETNDGFVVNTLGDGCFAAFQDAAPAVRAAVDAQDALTRHEWPPDATLRVRMGLHSGDATPVANDYTSLDVHRAARVSAAAHGGQIICSAATAAAARAVEADGIELRDLGPHTLKDFPDLERLHQVLRAGLTERFPPLRALPAGRNNLPLHRTSFVGRHRELREIRKLVENSDLVVLTGSAGAGKTRLALEVAAQVGPGFDDGVWLVELAGLDVGESESAAPSLVIGAAAEALGVRAVPGRELIDTLVEALRPKRLLLLLDNCEHLLDASAELADRILTRCAGVRILATSRQRIGIPAEVVWRTPLMDVPPATEETVQALMEHDATRLFFERASHTFPGFTINGNVATVVEICRRLDGIPLAIELAAAQVGVMEPREIAGLLDDRFRLLTEGNRAAAPRHRTLRAAIEWSVDLLADDERAVFEQLGVFAGTWTLSAAEQVCPSPGGRPTRELMRRLVDHSLVSLRVEQPDLRFGMLETIRELASARLAESSDAISARERHLRWYVELVKRVNLDGDAQNDWLRLLGAENDNLRTTLQFASDTTGHAADALALAARLAPFWRIRGQLAEGSGWLERALTSVSPDHPDRPLALMGAGGLAIMRGDYVRGRDQLEESAALFRANGDVAGAARTALDLAWAAWHEGDMVRAAGLLESYLDALDGAGDTKGLGDAHRMLGVIAAEQHDLDLATSHLQRALDLFRRVADELGEAAALASLGITAEYRGDLRSACDLTEASLEIARRCGDVRRTTSALDNLGFFWQQRGDLERAARLHEESLALARAIGDVSLVGAALTNLGSTERQRGELTAARTALKESLGILRDTGDRSRDVADVLEELAATFAMEGDDRRALMLFAAAEGIRDAVAYPLRDFFRRMYDPIIGTARDHLSDDADAWQEGRTLPIDAAIDLAFAGLSH